MFAAFSKKKPASLFASPELSQYENAEVEFEPSQPLFVEPFEICAALGRIAVMDSNRLKMLGKVTCTVTAE